MFKYQLKDDAMMKLIFAFCMFSILSINSIPAFSQSIPCEPNRVGLSDTTIKLTDADMPPLSPSMPYNVLLGYLVADSVFKQFDRKQMTEFMRRQTDNDTLKYMKKFMYLIEDYNPIDFYLYLSHEKSTYKLFTDNAEQLIYSQLTKMSNQPFIDYILSASFFIAHVNIIDTIRRVQVTDVDSNMEIAIAECQIIDTIKGKVIPECHDLNIIGHDIKNINKNKILSYQPALPGSCLQFQYTIQWHRGAPYGPYLMDSTGKQLTKKNMEYIVFLRPRLICWDSTSTYYYFTPVNTGSITYSMYPIINGIVQDPNNDFGFGTGLTVSEFITNLRNKINTIINYPN